MANKATKAKAKAASNAAKTGKPTITDFALKAKNPANKRTSPWRGAAKTGKKPSHEMAA